MAREISPYSIHNLDTSSIQNLAQDLAERLQFNVVYGFDMYTDLWKISDVENRVGFNKLGEIIINESFETYKLVQNEYFENELYKIYGNALFSKKEFWYGTENSLNQMQIDQYLNGYKFPYFELDTLDEQTDEGIRLVIYKNVIELSVEFLTDWNNLVRNIQKEMYLDALHKFRKANMQYAKLFGGAKVYYINDESSHVRIGQGNMNSMSINEFETAIDNTDKLYFENLSDLFLNHEILEQYKKRIDENLDYPGLFIDDFRDLEN